MIESTDKSVPMPFNLLGNDCCICIRHYAESFLEKQMHWYTIKNRSGAAEDAPALPDFYFTLIGATRNDNRTDCGVGQRLYGIDPYTCRSN